jgi:K+-transporting ATPase A subunit
VGDERSGNRQQFVIVLVGCLTYLPALALGPVADAL